MAKTVMVAIIQNQAPYILEWVAHHLALGFDDFVLCVHGSSDGSTKITRRLSGMGYAAHVKFRVEGDDPRASAFAQIKDLPELKEADWIFETDVDCFLNSHIGFGSLREMLEPVDPTVRSLSVPGAFFGADGHAPFESGRSITRSVMRGAYRPELAMGCGRNLGDLMSLERRVDLSPEQAQVNVYRSKSLAEFISRNAQQILDDPEKAHIKWREVDQQETRDETITRYKDMRDRYLSQLLEDERLRGVFEGSLAWHKERAERLLENPQIAAFADRIST